MNIIAAAWAEPLCTICNKPLDKSSNKVAVDSLHHYAHEACYRAAERKLQEKLEGIAQRYCQETEQAWRDFHEVVNPPSTPPLPESSPSPAAPAGRRAAR